MWKRFINTFPGRKVGHDKSLKQAQAFELVRLLWKMMIKQDDSEISDLIRSPSRLLFVAAEHGNTKFLIELIEAYPDLIWKVNRTKAYFMLPFYIVMQEYSIFYMR
ncbi:LOW QUALITY PROTEIN: hypothetical protein CsSME_00029648 [Camellia sinensis var. sinensis]